jgi:hypothetical protein
MSAARSDRDHAHQVELGIEAQVIAREEEKLLVVATAEMKRACAIHRRLDCVLHELTGALDGVPA